MNNRFKANKGFTLIEVLVASVILFSVIALVGLIYKGVVTSSVKASHHIGISAAVPHVSEFIKKQIIKESNTEQIALQGHGQWDVAKFTWKAELLHSQAALAFTDHESQKVIQPPAKFKLWLVTLTLAVNGTKKSFQYKELGWNES